MKCELRIGTVEPQYELYLFPETSEEALILGMVGSRQVRAQPNFEGHPSYAKVKWLRLNFSRQDDNRSE